MLPSQLIPGAPSLVGILIRAVISVGMLSQTPYADAQTHTQKPTPCAARSEIVARLTDRYGETLQSAGLSRGHDLLEVFASPGTGSWTILLTTPRGLSCLVASGDMWKPEAPALPGENA